MENGIYNMEDTLCALFVVTDNNKTIVFLVFIITFGIDKEQNVYSKNLNMPPFFGQNGAFGRENMLRNCSQNLWI